jgi:hypothetical protein
MGFHTDRFLSFDSFPFLMKNRLLFIAVSAFALVALPCCATSRDFEGPVLPADPSPATDDLFPQDEAPTIGDQVRNAVSRVNIAGEIRDGMLCARATVLGIGPEICIGFVPLFRSPNRKPGPTPTPTLETVTP